MIEALGLLRSVGHDPAAGRKARASREGCRALGRWPAQSGLELGQVLGLSRPGSHAGAGYGRLGQVGSWPAQVVWLESGHRLDPSRASCLLLDVVYFSSSVTSDQASVIGNPVVLVAVGSDCIYLGISPNK